jgi:hypothetical protein
MRVNDALGWLWEASGVLLPGAYLVSADPGFNELFLQGRVS